MRYIIYTVFFIQFSQYCHTRVLTGSKGLLMINPLSNDGSVQTESTSYNDTVLFYLYTKNSPSTATQLWVNATDAIKSSNFDFSKKTVIVTHGYMDDVNSDITQSIKNDLLKFDDVNVIGLDWSHFTKSLLYTWVVSEVPNVGQFVGEMANYLVSLGLSTSNVHLVGHSLGAHVSGFAGKRMQESGFVPARVSGLDPALPGFNGDNPSSRLASTDAQFVDCIHTCGGKLGYAVPICQADFYPNGGVDIQPGCEWFDFGVCSHGRSFEYFASSINATNKFYAESCNAVVGGVPYGCSSSSAEMGYFATPEYLGEFYLQTTGSFPFSMNITNISI
ncbi:Lipase [Nesidiocoris tenuis]|uniref:Lipase n=1 Tax=Nesidiocoris tenuis TaxID=355587 RepID=A0ABN7AQX9_9HEMI|nr:Lipase [Nesidiocoris tenuis]